MKSPETPKVNFDTGKKLPESAGPYVLDRMSVHDLATVPQEVVARLNLRAGDIGQDVHFEDFKEFRRVTYPHGEIGYIALEKPKEQHGYTKESVYIVDCMNDQVTGDLEMQYIFSKSVKKQLEDPSDTPFVFWSGTSQGFEREGRGRRRAELANAIAQELYPDKTLHSGRLREDNDAMNLLWEKLRDEGLAEIAKFKHGAQRIAFKKK